MLFLLYKASSHSITAFNNFSVFILMCIKTSKIIYLGRTITQNMKMQIVGQVPLYSQIHGMMFLELGIPSSAARISCCNTIPLLCVGHRFPDWDVHGLISWIPLRVYHVHNITLYERESTQSFEEERQQWPLRCTLHLASVSHNKYLNKHLTIHDHPHLPKVI